MVLFRRDFPFFLVLGLALSLSVAGVSLSILRSEIVFKNPPLFSIAATIDMLIVAPLFYLYFINKTRVPNISVIFFSILMVFTGSVFIPGDLQMPLTYYKIFILPVIESLLVLYLASRFRSLNRARKNNKFYRHDKFLAFKTVLTDTMSKSLGAYFSIELGLAFYTFFKWRHKNKTRYTYKNSGSGILAVLNIFLLMLVVETFAVHLLLSLWSKTLAWVLTAFGIYTFIQITGVMKSLLFRPVFICENQLYLNYGLLRNVIVDCNKIQRVALNTTGKILLSPFKDLESSNVTLYFTEPVVVDGLFGKVIETSELSFYLNDKEKFYEDLGGFIGAKTV